MREFCTLFDSFYLHRAIALHASLVEHAQPFHLTALTFDDEAQRLLEALDLPGLTPVPLGVLEAHDPAFAATRPSRTRAEYCWTATPALLRFLIDTRPEVKEVTYLDADLLFFADPQPLFTEMGDASVLIAPHRYPPAYMHYAKAGIYNVQFNPFRRTPDGLACLDWWRERCIDWCHDRLENGRYGDQKYLDEFTSRFPGVHVLEHRGGGVAPWNVSAYDVRRVSDGTILVDDDPLIFFHFHQVRLLADGGYLGPPPGYHVPRAVRRLIYEPYFAALDEAKRTVAAVDPEFSAGLVDPPTPVERVRRARLRLASHAVRHVPWLARFSRGG